MRAEGGTCTDCGACCATYRVSFRRHELDSQSGGWVPAAFTEELNERGVCMRGTKDRPRRCLALRGAIGVEVSCAIYAQRPSPCRAFARGGGRPRRCSLRRRTPPPRPASPDGVLRWISYRLAAPPRCSCHDPASLHCAPSAARIAIGRRSRPRQS